MRTPSWEISPGALAALFDSMTVSDDVPLVLADAWTFELPNGTTYRWSGLDAPITLGTRTFEVGPGIKRNSIKWRVGITTDTLSATITDNVGTLINGTPLMAFIAARGFDNAAVTLERVFYRSGETTPTGALIWFVGDVDDGEIDRYQATLTIASFTRRLEVSVPNGVYQTLCLNRVFDPRCGLNAASWTASGAATGATNTAQNSFPHNLNSTTYPAGWGTLGLITMTSGANAGVQRTCKLHSTSALQSLQPWPAPVAPGDTFTLRAGCDRLRGTCQSKFANLNRFRGTPFVPVPETVL